MNVMLNSGRQDQKRTRRQIMGLSFSGHFQPTLQHLHRHNPFGKVLRHCGASIKQEQRDGKTPVPVKESPVDDCGSQAMAQPGALPQLSPDRYGAAADESALPDVAAYVRFVRS